MMSTANVFGRALAQSFRAGVRATVIAVGVLLATVTALADATITTDAVDYPPGATVFITGAGFEAGETVTISIVHSDGDGTTHDVGAALVGDDGSFDATWTVQDDCANETLDLTGFAKRVGLGLGIPPLRLTGSEPEPFSAPPERPR